MINLLILLLKAIVSKKTLTIPELSEVEGLSTSNVGKILRVLRLARFIESSRGQTGGYKLSKPTNQILVSDVLTSLGGKLYESNFCDLHAGIENICTNSIDCSIRSLWKTIQNMLDGVLSKFTLQDLIGKEEEVQALALAFAEQLEAKFNKN
jgi:Rrf2 family protein